MLLVEIKRQMEREWIGGFCLTESVKLLEPWRWDILAEYHTA